MKKETDIKRVKSPGDVCLSRVATSVPELYRNEVAPGEFFTEVKIEHRAWECPLCHEGQEYFLVNGNVIKGLGGGSIHGNHVVVDCCMSASCHAKANQIIDGHTHSEYPEVTA